MACRNSKRKFGKRKERASVIVILTVLSLIYLQNVLAVPIGPEATLVSNTTDSALSNTTINESSGASFIYTYTFSSEEQNLRWKAYVGNVTGSLSLDNANSSTIYSWPLGVVGGEVYATRNDTTVQWTQINCSWAVTGNVTNRTISEAEDVAMQHSRLDNITATFNETNHTAFLVGTRPIDQDTCYSIYPYVNDSAQTTTTFFPEVMLYDGTTIDNGKVVYASIVEQDVSGYNGNNPAVNATYDFQMLLPEIGIDSPGTTTAYYFYVELT